MNSGNDIPSVLGDRYEVGELLGRGGMAEVHLSRDSRLGRLVAVKMLRPDLARDPTFQARFRREAHSAAALNHPSVVAVYDTGEDSFVDRGGSTARVPYIVMEYVEGQTGKELLQAVDDGAGSGLGTERAARITDGVLEALAYSHRQGIIHRDIKPANVMITPTGQVKVMDFGIARAIADTSATMTATSAVIGTAQYLSPEQARGESVDARTDLYSAGCLLYELLTGRPPFVGDSPVSVAYQHVREIPLPPSDYNPAISDALDRVVLKALAKDREDRYADAEQFRQDLLAAVGGRAVGAPAVGTATAMATQALPSAMEATQALAAAGLGGPAVGGAAVGGAVVGGAAATAMTRRLGPGDRPPPDLYDDPYDDPAPVGTRTRQVPEEPPRRRTGAIIGVVVAVLVTLGLLGVVLANLLGPRDPVVATEVPVPAVVGQPEASARTQITDADLVPGELRMADQAPAGQVILQDPAGGAMAAPASTVTLTISTGPDAVTVPDVAESTDGQARDELKAAGLVPGETVEEASAEVRAGRVIRTDPAQGATAAPGDAVTLYVSTGQLEVPDYAGATLEEARRELTDLKLLVKVRYEPTPDAEQNIVLGQDPPAGPVDPGSTVTLSVTSLPDPSASPTETPTPTETVPGESSGTETTTGTSSSTGSTSAAPSSSPTTLSGSSITETPSGTSSSGRDG